MVVVTHQAEKIWTYDRTTVRSYDRPYKVLLLTCVVNCTAGTPTPRLCPVVQWSVHWAPSRTTRVLFLAGARRCALGRSGKKKRELRFLAWLNLDITLQKLRAGRWGWGWGLTDTHIDMSSFYLRNEFFFPLELRRHSETTLHNGDSPLAEANV